MATSLKKKSNLLKDDSSDWTTNTDSKNSFLSEEQRLLHSKLCPTTKKSNTEQKLPKRITKFNTLVNQMTSEQIDEELERRQLSTSGDIEVRRLRLKHHNHLGSIKTEQDFDYIAVIDFEATCEERQNNYKNEIIEFPIVLINVKEQTIVDKFQSYCRPVLNPILSKFCTDLTGIEQHQVNNAPRFPEVLQNVEKWLNERNLLSNTNKYRLAFATDGPWDFANFLQLQCQLSSISYPKWAEQWINIRKEFSRFYGLRRCGIEKMLGKLGLNFEGRQHSGLDDATNIARIAIELLKDGCAFVLNDAIRSSDPKCARLTGEKTDSNVQEDYVIFED